MSGSSIGSSDLKAPPAPSVMACWRHTLAPFLMDSKIGAPTSEAVAEDCLGADAERSNKLKGKLAIVTGCTVGGIGAQTAGVLAGRARLRVVIAGRSANRLTECAEEIRSKYPEAQVFPLVLDLASLESVRAFVGAFERAFPAAGEANDLALLVNNAGIMAPPYSLTSDGYESQMGTNHLGPFLLTNLLLGRLKAAAGRGVEGVRVVTVASNAHAIPVPLDPSKLSRPYARTLGPMLAYGQSKRCNVLMAKELARRLQGTGVGSLALHPGNVASNLGHDNLFFRLALKAVPCVHKSVTQGAATTVKAALDPVLDQAARMGAYLQACAVHPALGCDDPALNKAVWEASSELVGLRGRRSSGDSTPHS